MSDWNPSPQLVRKSAVVGVRVLVVAAAALLGSGCSSAVDFRDRRIPSAPAEQRRPPTLERLTVAERRDLVAGRLVRQPMVQERAGRRYFGGSAHVLVHESAQQVLAMLADPKVFESVLPRTKRATVLEQGEGFRRVELLQGNSWVEATYTVTLNVAPPTGALASNSVTFALDRERPHDIDDVWGTFRVEPITPSDCVVSLTAFVDLGSSLAGMFEGRIQDLILSTPLGVRRYVQSVRAAAAVSGL